MANKLGVDMEEILLMKLEQNKKIAKMGGHTAKVARDDLEKNLGKTVITSQNNLHYQYINEIETK